MLRSYFNLMNEVVEKSTIFFKKTFPKKKKKKKKLKVPV